MALMHRVSMESIEFQDGKFFEALVRDIKQVRSLYVSVDGAKYYANKQFDTLVKTIKTFTGLSIRFKHSAFGPAVEYPKILNNHILTQFDPVEVKVDWLEKDIEKLKSKSILKGFVDLKGSKVSGLFSDIGCNVLWPKHLFSSEGKLSNEELAAVLLHELGHCFTFFEFSNRVVRTNQALSLLNKTLDKSTSEESKQVIFKTISDTSKTTPNELDLLKSSKSPAEIAVLYLGIDVRNSISELGCSVYDHTGSEYLADQFATRHGAGKHLVVALDKLGGLRSNNPLLDGIILTSVMLGFSILNPFAAVYTGSIIFALLVGTYFGNQIYDNIYDVSKSRLLRVKYQNTERLKDRDITKDEQTKYLEQNEHLIVIEKTLNDKRDFFTTIVTFLNPKKRNQANFQILQKELESFASNQLFDKAAKLQTL